MAGPAPKTDRWTARENTQGKHGIVLIVSGLVEVTSTNKEPVLTEASGGGGYGKTLALDLTMRSGEGEDLQVLVWKRATFSRDVSANHYDNVEIRWEGKTIATVKVLDDDEHHEHLSDLTHAANKTAPKPKPPARKKTAKKPAHPEPKKPAPAAKKKVPAAKKKAAPAKKAKKRSAAAKKRTPAKKRGGAKKRSPVKKMVSAAKKMMRGAKKRPSAKKRGGAKKRRSGTRRR
jgi:hypothetical protein